MTATITTAAPTRPSSSLKKAGPWVGEDNSKSDPLPPLDEYDDRPCVRDLIQLHRTQIDAIANRLQSQYPQLYDPIKQDDLWILRFLLDHSSNNMNYNNVNNKNKAHSWTMTTPIMDKITSNIGKFLHYRQEHRLDDMDIKSFVPGPSCLKCAGVRHFFATLDDPNGMILSHPDPHRGIVMEIRAAAWNLSKLNVAFSQEDWPNWYFLEWTFQMLDNVTRQTGRLTKAVRFLDLANYHHGRQGNKECISRMAANAHETTEYYPQMFATVFVLNAPVWSKVVYRALRPLLPKSFVEKLVVFQPSSKRDYENVLKYISAQDLPLELKTSMSMATSSSMFSILPGSSLSSTLKESGLSDEEACPIKALAAS